MPWETRIPQITPLISLELQKTVVMTGEHVEFLAVEKAQMRRDSGKEVRSLRWRANKGKPHQGWMIAGTFYTRFSEYGTVKQAARPILGPAADEAEPYFLAQAHAALGQAVR